MPGPIRSIPWRQRLEARVIGGVIVLVALSVAAVLVATTRVVTARSLARTSSDLEAALSTFRRLTNDRAEFASAQSALITALPIFRAHLADIRLAEDGPTLDAMAEDYRRQLKADFTIVGDRTGAPVASPGSPATIGTSPDVAAMMTAATAGRPVRGIVAHDSRLFLVVSETARFADEILGTLTVGYALDDAFVTQLAAVTHCEISLVGDGRLYTSSLPDSSRAAMTAAVGRTEWPPSGVSGTVERIGSADYAVGAFPLTSGSSVKTTPARLVLLQDQRFTRAFVDEIQRRVLAAGVVTSIIAIAMGILFSRRVSRPLRDLAAAAEDIAGGNWTRQVPVRGTAEETMMSEAVNAMTTSLRHWFEEVKTRDNQLRRAQKLEAIGQLAGGVAHDFNNILTAIVGFGGLLRLAIDEDDPRRGDCDRILKAAERASTLTRQLLVFSRRHVVALRVLALPTVVADTKKMLERVIGEDITLSTAIRDDVAMVHADPSQLEQVLLNLVVNARDAMPDGGTVCIDVANVVEQTPDGRAVGLQPGRYVRLSVRDEGCGMTPEVKARIFEPFFTTKPEGSGTGLGLSVVYGIVEQLGGAIDVDTEVGRGTTFHVFIPASEAQSAELTPQVIKETRERGSGTVLLVEDEPAVAAFVGRALKEIGYIVITARDAEEALGIAQARAAEIDVLLTDVVMPGMSGPQLAEYVVALRKNIRVLYMSGYSNEAILRRGVERDLVNFIQKPFSCDVLATKVWETLNTARHVPSDSSAECVRV